jgi:hypothetical protein
MEPRKTVVDDMLIRYQLVPGRLIASFTMLRSAGVQDVCWESGGPSGGKQSARTPH